MQRNIDRTIFLHVGPDKTGTTAIQKTLFLLDGMNVGTNYSSGRYVNDRLLTVNFCHKKKAEALFKIDKLSQNSRVTKYMLELEDRLKDDSVGDLVLSHEGLVHLSAEELSNLFNFLSPYCNDVKVIMYVRSPYEYATSAMSQRVKTGRRAFFFNMPMLNYKFFLEKFVSVFGEESLIIRKYDKKIFPEGNIVFDFLFSIGIDYKNAGFPEVIVDSEENKSISHEAMIVGDFLAAILCGYNIYPKDYKDCVAPFLYSIQGGRICMTSLQFYLIKMFSAPKYKHSAIKFSFNITDINISCRSNSLKICFYEEAVDIYRQIEPHLAIRKMSKSELWIRFFLFKVVNR